MKTRNQFRKSKMQEIEQIWEQYPDLEPHERLFMVLDEFVKKALRTNDHTKLPSIGELAKKFGGGLFLNTKTGRPTADACNWVRRLMTAIKKDKGHPHIRPYTEPHVELLADGTDVVRNYVNFLRGSKAVTYVNLKLEEQKTGLKESQAANRDLVNVKRVMKEVDTYREELIFKQQEANRRKRGSDNK